MGRALWQRRVDTTYGPAVFDAQLARDTLAEAEAALRNGDASRAEATYLRTLGKLGPFSDPAWKSDRATDERTRSQCHARLAALAYDQRDFERSLRETAAAAAARHEAIACDRCTDDDVRFMMTALVHAATVHERMAALDEAARACRVALEFAAYADRNDAPGRDDRTRRSIASARRAAERLLDELARRGADATSPSSPTDGLWPPTDRDLDLSPLYVSPPVAITAIDLDRLVAEPAPRLPESEAIDLDLGDIRPEPTGAPLIDLTEAEPVIDLRATEPGPAATIDDRDHDDDEHDDDDEIVPVDARFERDPDQHRVRQAARRAELAAPAEGRGDHDPSEATDLAGHRYDGPLSEPAGTLLAQARAQALTARELLAHGDDAAAIHAHRAVRTATRARPWAKHDEQVTVEVALTLVDALVTRSDVLSAAGNDEVSQTDLRRARTVADHLWRACPAPTTAAAAVLVCTRSAARGWHRDDEAELAAHLEQATMIINDAETLGVGLPAELVTFEPPAGAVGEREALLALGDRLFGALHAAVLEPA